MSYSEEHHHHHIHADVHKKKAFIFGIMLNVIFVIAEFITGGIFNSSGLLADAGHNLSDVSGLLISFGALLLAGRQYTKDYTYGFSKATILASFANAIILLCAVAYIIAECVHKFIYPVAVNGWPIIITAAIGIVINGLTVFLFNRDKDHDLNVRGAYLHMIADTLVSVGVVVSGVLMLITGCSIIDPIVGLIIAVVILYSTWGLLKDSTRLILDGVPNHMNISDIVDKMQSHPNVAGVHHMHVWPISTTSNALTVHVVLCDIDACRQTRADLQKILDEYGIEHATFEFEKMPCENLDCKNCESE